MSYSIPLKNMAVDPNELAMWDDSLVEAWRENKRFTLLIRMDRYPASYGEMQFFLTLDEDCEFSYPNPSSARSDWTQINHRRRK